MRRFGSSIASAPPPSHVGMISPRFHCLAARDVTGADAAALRCERAEAGWQVAPIARPRALGVGRRWDQISSVG